MNFFLILTLFSILVQAISCDKKVTFSELVEQFIAKTENQKMPIKSKFEFVIRISNNINKILKIFNTPVKEFINQETAKKVFSRVPEDYVNYEKRLFNKRVGRKWFVGKIIAVNKTQRHIKKLYETISYEIQIKDIRLVSRCEKGEHPIDRKYFNDWVQRDLVPSHVKLIESELKPMASLFGEYNSKLIELVKKSISERSKLKIRISSAYLSFGEIMYSDFEGEKLTNALDELFLIVEKVRRKQADLINVLKQIWSHLRKYNVERLKFAEFMIGFRDSLDDSDSDSSWDSD